MRKILCSRSNVYDWVNETVWTEDFLRKVTPEINENYHKNWRNHPLVEFQEGNYVFDEADKSVYFIAE